MGTPTILLPTAGSNTNSVRRVETALGPQRLAHTSDAGNSRFQIELKGGVLAVGMTEAPPANSQRSYVDCYHGIVAQSPNNAQPLLLDTVFLDRDGVVNEKMPENCYVTALSQFHLLPGVGEAIGRLNREGIRVIVVSNQRGISLGLYSAAHVQAIHLGVQDMLKTHEAHVDDFYFCPHDRHQCDCRKPLSGMFEQAVAQCPAITAATSVMIGDSDSDIEFGRRLGMRTVFIEVAPNRQSPNAEQARHKADLAFPSLIDAVDFLLLHRRKTA